MMQVKIFEFNYFPVNTYLLYDETGEAVIIDCGCVNPEEEKELSSFIEKNNLKLTHSLFTHLHLDHVFGKAFIAEKYGLQPEAHQEDVKVLPSLEMQGKPFGIKLSAPDIPIGKYITDGEVIRFGNTTLSVIHVPGHSPGSVVFYNEKDGIVISGDVLFYGSIGRTDLWGGNQNQLIDNINRKLLTLPDKTIVYPGHGPKTTIGYEKINNPYI